MAHAPDRSDAIAVDEAQPDMMRLINEYMEDVEAASATPGGQLLPRALPTGLEQLDFLGAITPQTLTVIYGPPGAGASTLAQGIARASAVGHDIPALHVSWQSPSAEVINRLLAAESAAPALHMRRGTMRDEDWTNLADALSRVGAAPLTLLDGPRALSRLVEVITQWRDEHDASRALVVLDGLDALARLDSPRRKEGWEDHARVTAEIKQLTRELDIAVVATVPINREYRQRTDKRPALTDVAYSPSYATDADLVIAIHREDLFAPSVRPGHADLLLYKARHIPQGVITVEFQGRYARFCDLAE